MNRKERIEQEVEKTLACFGHAEKIEANPLFYNRLQARIRQLESGLYRSPVPVSAFAYFQPAVLALIIVVNVLTATVILRYNDAGYTRRSEMLQHVSQELFISSGENSLFIVGE